MFWLFYVLIGGIAGWIVARMLNRDTSGTILDIIIGIVGAILGGWLLTLVVKVVWSLATALIGALIFLFIVWIIRSNNDKKRNTDSD